MKKKSHLDKLAIKYKSDKFGSHYYTPIYERYMESKKSEKINILEIGIGGYVPGKKYTDKYKGGESLRMWKDYFSKGKIIGLDIVEKKLKLGKRVEIFKGSQRNSKVLSDIVKKYKKFDFIVDDGSHLYKDVIFSFKSLFNNLKDGGYYFVEDTQASYIREFGGDGAYLKNKNTIKNYFKDIVDKINHKEIENPFYKIDSIAKNVTEIHFYHNMIVVKKDKNVEKSNILKNNKRTVSGKNAIKIRKIFKFIKYLYFHLKGKCNYFLDYFKI